jgi:hypothetical protein
LVLPLSAVNTYEDGCPLISTTPDSKNACDAWPVPDSFRHWAQWHCTILTGAAWAV